jgi:PAS domain S-box-containing protein
MNERARILVVDDDREILRLTTRLLREAGYEVLSAATGSAGLQLATKKVPDLILLDIVLPDVGGIELCQRIKAEPTLTSCFVALISGLKIASEDQAIGLEGGADEYIVRPISNRELLARVRAMLRLKRAQDELGRERDRISRIMETSPVGILVLDRQGHVVYGNPQVAEIAGTNLKDLMRRDHGDSMRRIIDEADQALPVEQWPFVQVMSTKEPIHDECHVVELADGGKLFLSVNAVPLTSESGQVDGMVVVVEDITRRVKAEEGLRESEERLRSTLSSLDDLVFVVDRHGVFVDYYRPVTSSELYVSAETFLGKTVREIMPPEVAEPFQEAFDAIEDTKVQQFDYPLTLAGKREWFSAKLSIRRDSQGEFAGVTAVSRNITERKRTEKALERRNRVLEILNRLSEAVWSTLEMGPMLDAVVRVAVQAIDVTSGYIYDWDEGQKTTVCLAEYHRPKASDAERVSKLGIMHHVEEDPEEPGNWLYSSEAYHIAHWDDPHASLKAQASMQERTIKSMLNVPLKLRGQPFGYIELWETRHRRVFTNEETDLILAIARQVSMGIENAQLYEKAQQELADRKRAQDRMQASLQEKEVLLKEIHHRVKNNLQVISSLLDMQALSTQNPEAIEVLEDSQHRVKTMAFVHERLYQSEDLASIDVAEYVESLTNHLLTAYEGRAGAIALDLRIDDVVLDLDTAVATGLIINELVSNSLKHAFPPQGEGEGEILVALGSLDDDRLELQVCDNGVGLPPDLDVQDSQSLGLRLVNMLTQQLRGALDLDRSAGAAFRITFAGQAGPAPRR